MNRDDILRMAREALILDVMSCQCPTVERAIERFAALVAAAAKAQEREECMRICNDTEEAFLDALSADGDMRRNKRAQGGAIAASDIADAIRARGEK